MSHAENMFLMIAAKNAAQNQPKPTEKLIRDLLDRRIPPDEVRIETDPAKVEEMLRTKLGEEIAELKATDYKDPQEFADVIEVLHALARRAGLSPEQIEEVRIKKAAEKGGFERGLVYVPKG